MLSPLRRRLLRAVAWPTARSVPWLHVGGVLLLGWLPLLVVLARGDRELVAAVTFAGVVATGALALVVDDPAAELTASLPVPLAPRRAVRLVEVLLVYGVVGATLLAVGTRRDPALWSSLDLRAPEVLATAAASLATGSVLARGRTPSAGLTGAAAGPIGVGLVAVLSQRFAWLPGIAGQHHGRWWWVAAVAGAAAAWAWRDPLRVGPVRSRR